MERLKNESQEDYKKRRNQFNSWQKFTLSRAKWFWKSKVVFIDSVKELEFLKYGSKDFESNGTYENEHKKQNRISFTQKLRNERGYDNHLKLKYQY